MTQPLWSKDKKPAYLEGRTNEDDVYLTERGWVIRRPWSTSADGQHIFEELEVAMPGASLDVKDDQGTVVEEFRANITDINFTAGDYTVADDPKPTVTIDLVFDEKVNFDVTSGTPTIASDPANLTFSLVGYPTARKKNQLRFEVELQGTETLVDDLTLAGEIVLNGGTITDAGTDDPSTLTIPVEYRTLTGVNLV